MAAVTRAALVALLVAARPARAETVAQWRPFVTEASRRFGVPAAWIEHVMQAESEGRTTLAGRPIVSHAGAMGLMQLMPKTWTALRASLHLGRNAFDPRDNILAGTAFLRLMHDRFGYPGMFAAYNAGPGRYAAFLSGKAGLPGETRDYLVRVTGHGIGGSGAISARRPASLFAALRSTGPDKAASDPPAPPPSLFAIRR